MLPLAPYQPPFWLFNGHLQTLWPVWKTLRLPPIAWPRERWLTPDNDFIDVDCIHAGDVDARAQLGHPPLENCIASTSIKKYLKLQRANGGCLGARCR